MPRIIEAANFKEPVRDILSSQTTTVKHYRLVPKGDCKGGFKMHLDGPALYVEHAEAKGLVLAVPLSNVSCLEMREDTAPQQQGKK